MNCIYLFLVTILPFVGAALVDGIPGCGSGDYAVTEFSWRNENLVDWVNDDTNADASVRAFLVPDTVIAANVRASREEPRDYCQRMCAKAIDSIDVPDNTFRRPACRSTCEGAGCKLFARVEKEHAFAIADGKCSCRIPVKAHLKVSWTCGPCEAEETIRDADLNLERRCTFNDVGIARCCLLPTGADEIPPRPSEIRIDPNDGKRQLNADSLLGGDDENVVSRLCRDYTCEDCGDKGVLDVITDGPNYECKEDDSRRFVRCCEKATDDSAKCRNFRRCAFGDANCPRADRTVEIEGRAENTAEYDTTDKSVKVCERDGNCRRLRCNETDTTKCDNTHPQVEDETRVFTCFRSNADVNIHVCCSLKIGAVDAEKKCAIFVDAREVVNDAWKCFRNGIRGVTCRRANGEKMEGNLIERRCCHCNFDERDSEGFLAAEGDEQFSCRVVHRDRAFKDEGLVVKSETEIECISEKENANATRRFCRYTRCDIDEDRAPNVPDRPPELSHQCRRNDDKTVTCCIRLGANTDIRKCRTFNEPQCKYNRDSLKNADPTDVACDRVPPVNDCIEKGDKTVCCRAFGERNEFVECRVAACVNNDNQRTRVCVAAFTDGAVLRKSRNLDDVEAPNRDRCARNNRTEDTICDKKCRVNPIDNTRECYKRKCVRDIEKRTVRCCRVRIDDESEITGSCRVFEKPEIDCITRVRDGADVLICKRDDTNDRPIRKAERVDGEARIESRTVIDAERPNVESEIAHRIARNRLHHAVSIIRDGKKTREDVVETIYKRITCFVDSNGDRRIQPEEIETDFDLEVEGDWKTQVDVEDTTRDGQRTIIAEEERTDGLCKIRQYVAERDIAFEDQTVDGSVRIVAGEREEIVEIRQPDSVRDSFKAIELELRANSRDIKYRREGRDFVLERADGTFFYRWRYEARARAIAGIESRVDVEIEEDIVEEIEDEVTDTRTIRIVLVIATTERHIRIDPTSIASNGEESEDSTEATSEPKETDTNKTSEPEETDTNKTSEPKDTDTDKTSEPKTSEGKVSTKKSSGEKVSEESSSSTVIISVLLLLVALLF